MAECQHKKIKRNYPFGKKSKARMFCKNCGKVISGTDLKNIRENKNSKR